MLERRSSGCGAFWEEGTLGHWGSLLNLGEMEDIDLPGPRGGALLDSFMFLDRKIYQNRTTRGVMVFTQCQPRARLSGAILGSPSPGGRGDLNPHRR